MKKTRTGRPKGRAAKFVLCATNIYPVESSCVFPAALPRKTKIGRLSAGFVHRYGLGLRSVFFMPRLDHISSGRQIFNFISPVFLAHSKERVWKHTGIGTHPRMHIAFELDHDFGFV